MKAVYKYPIPWPPTSDAFTVRLPLKAQPLTVQVQHGVPCIWALTDPDETVTSERPFRIAGTGHDIKEAVDVASYVGTVQMLEGSLVFHIFEAEAS